MKAVARPMLKYMLVLCIALVALVLVPSFSLWLPTRLGL
jgi:TRAP-type C4-dicarboxylate transport system permease large subunit